MANPGTGSRSFTIALAGMLSLAVGMGIGRFAFTPMLPLMIREGQLDVAAGGWLAAANYLGYFVGALTAARVRLGAAALGLLALAATAALTAVMAWPGFALWVVARFLAGAASAWVFVATSVWCLGALAAAGAHRRAGIVYAGVGTGMAAAGLYCWLGGANGAGAASLWLQLAGLSLALMAPVAYVLRSGSPAAPVPTPPPAGLAPAATRGIVACYGAMGFGYILPATFLPVMARTVVDDPVWFGLAWPVFGITAALSTLVAPWWIARSSRLSVWMHCHWLMGLGALLPSLWANGFTIALSALLVGGTFMIVTLVGVQEMRARASHAAAAAVGRMTAAFAFGQIAGPVASALLLHLPALRESGLAIALQAGAITLFISAWWLRGQASSSPSVTEVPHVR